MKRKRIIIAVSIALLAILWTAFFWLHLGGPLLQRAFHGTPAGAPPEPFQARENVRGQFRQIQPVEEIVGIGAVMRFDDEARLPMVMNAVPGSPADRAGLRSGMLIQKVDDTALAGLPLAECINLIRGPAGSKVRIEVSDPAQNTVIKVELTRERVRLRPQ